MEIIDLCDKDDQGPEIWLLRHGKTVHNLPDKTAIFAGSRTDTPLSAEGARQTKRLVKELLERTGGFDLVVTSRMKRAVQTGEIIAREIQENSAANIDQCQIDDFQEIDTGDFTGLSEKEAAELDFKAADAFYNNNFEALAFPNGENYKSLQERVSKTLIQLKKLQASHQKIILIGHGMFNRVMIYKLFMGKTIIWQSRDYPHDRIIKMVV